jgi:hypothetical protein
MPDEQSGADEAMTDLSGSRMIEEDPNEEKAWDKFLRTGPVEAAEEQQPDGWKLLHDGRSLEAALIAANGELVGDLIWGNLGLPIKKTLEKLEEVDAILKTPEAERTVEQCQEEAACRRECREMLELSTQQLEEMMEKKGEFGREYRIVTAAWYMMMLPHTHLGSPLCARGPPFAPRRAPPRARARSPASLPRGARAAWHRTMRPRRPGSSRSASTSGGASRARSGARHARTRSCLTRPRRCCSHTRLGRRAGGTSSR